MNPSSFKMSIILISVVIFTCFFTTKVDARVKTLSCQEPALVKDADITVLMLPYKDLGSSKHIPPKIFSQISHLITMDLLLSTAKFNKVGIVQFKNDSSGACDQDLVLEKLNMGTIPEEHGMVFFWGDFSIKGEKLYIRHHLKFLRKELAESLAIKIGDQDFKGTLPYDSVSFRKRVITEQKEKVLEKLSSVPLTIREKPYKNARGSDFPKRLHQSSSYIRDGIFKNWVHIKSFNPALSGWHLPENDTNKRLREIFPELNFLEGSVAYLLGSHMHSDRKMPPDLHLVTTSKAALKNYEDEIKSKGNDFARATAFSLRAALEIIDYGDPKARFNDAHKNLKKALALAPSSSNIVNLEAITKLYNEYLKSDGNLTQIKQREISLGFSKARELDLNNSDANENNFSFRELLLYASKRQYTRGGTTNNLDIHKLNREKQFLQNIATPDCRYYSPYNTTRRNTLRDKEFALFPSGDLFRPLLADPKELRFSLGTLMRVKPENADSFNGQTISIGGEWRFARYRLRKSGPCNGIQINFHAALFSFYKHRDKAIGIIDADLINSDYVIGSSITFRDKNFSTRLRFNSLNSNLSDKNALGDPKTDTLVGFRELELLTAYDFHLHRRNDMRVFGGMGYLFRRNPDIQRLKFHYGLEIRHFLHFFIPKKSFFKGRYPIYFVLGTDFKRFEQHNYNVDRSITVGFEFFNVLSQNRWRILYRYYDGFNPYGNFYKQKLRMSSLELGIEF